MNTEGCEIPNLRRTALEIVAISFVVLFQELVLIRWLPGQIRVLAYFPNLILISAFLGLGLGCLASGRRSLLWLWPSSLLATVASAVALSGVAFTQNSVSEHLWLLYFDLGRDATVIPAVQPPILAMFVLGALGFIPLGQLLAERIERFRATSSSLWGYSWDLLGSLLGVAGFAAIAYLGVFPWLWFAIFLAVAGLAFVPAGRPRLLVLGALILIPLLVHVFEKAAWYSPYYAISVTERSDSSGFAVLANGSMHQQALSLQSTGPPQTEREIRLTELYHHPYRQLRSKPERVLVLGAGTGNDISVLLDEGVAQIDAVEIDPVIRRLGLLHPDRPYDSDRVTVHTTDARSYLNESEERYDLIVFGTLDSMTRLSALSNVRLDNFVYTRECLEAARARLTEDGGIVLYFMVATDYIDERLLGLMAATFGEMPAVWECQPLLFNRVYMGGPAFSHLQRPGSALDALFFQPWLEQLDLPTDDWPFLYLRSRSISTFYLGLIGWLLTIAVLSVFLLSRDMRRSLSRRGGIDLEMFLYGAAFLLIETKFVTAMNLLWGATWLTSSVVFGSVLLMILAATIATELHPPRWWVAAGGLLLSLLATWMIPLRWLLVEHWGLRLVLSTLFVGTPIFFAATCFAVRFRARRSAGVALGWNLLGAVTGGLLEFLSMIVGLKALSLVAIAAYLGSFWVRERGLASNDDKASPGAEPSSA